MPECGGYLARIAGGRRRTEGQCRRGACGKATFDFAQRQRALGTISLVAVLNAEQSYAQAALTLVQAQANRYADTAGLFQFLGGGWWKRKGEPHYEQLGPSGR